MESTFLNPDAYLNHLPPDIVTQLEVARNLTIAVLGALIWDILVYFPGDIAILRRSPIRLVSLCFITTRFFASAFVTLSVIRQTVPMEECMGGVVKGLGATCMFTNLTASFLFLQRLRAVYARKYWVQWVFFVLWLAANGLMTTTIYGALLGHIPGTKYCIYVKVHQYMSAPGFMVAFFDTAVFVAISYKISVLHSEPGTGITWDTLISGRALPQLSKAVLQGGQQYYLITICFSIPVALLILIPAGIPPTYQLMLTFPMMALTPSMACRVFRNLRLQDFHDTETSSTTIPNANLPPRSYTQRFILDTGEMRQPISEIQDGAHTNHLELRHVPSQDRSTEWEHVEIVIPNRHPVAGLSSGIRATKEE